MNSSSKLPTVVAITGASGSILGFRLVKALLELEEPVELIISSNSDPVILEETGLIIPKNPENLKESLLEYLDITSEKKRELLRCFSNRHLGAPSASGTHLTKGMVIIPCSMATLGKIASGISDNLITRSADVVLKENRRLILVPRESPFSQIHLKNMLTLNQAGATIIPPLLSFYQEAFQSVDGQINYTLGKVLDHLGLTNHGLIPRWGA